MSLCCLSKSCQSNEGEAELFKRIGNLGRLRPKRCRANGQTALQRGDRGRKFAALQADRSQDVQGFGCLDMTRAEVSFFQTDSTLSTHECIRFAGAPVLDARLN